MQPTHGSGCCWLHTNAIKKPLQTCVPCSPTNYIVFKYTDNIFSHILALKHVPGFTFEGNLGWDWLKENTLPRVLFKKVPIFLQDKVAQRCPLSKPITPIDSEKGQKSPHWFLDNWIQWIDGEEGNEKWALTERGSGWWREAESKTKCRQHWLQEINQTFKSAWCFRNVF